MDIGALETNDLLKSRDIAILRKLHIRTVEALLSRLENPQTVAALSEKLELEQNHLMSVARQARSLVPEFHSQAENSGVARGARPPL